MHYDFQQSIPCDQLYNDDYRAEAGIRDEFYYEIKGYHCPNSTDPIHLQGIQGNDNKNGTQRFYFMVGSCNVMADILGTSDADCKSEDDIMDALTKFTVKTQVVNNFFNPSYYYKNDY